MLPQDFSSLLVTFRVYPTKETQILWGSSEYDLDKRPAGACLKELCAVTEHLRNLGQMGEHPLEYTAERYGGIGAAGNGGGARCGNHPNGMQIKGIGLNPLISSSAKGGYATGTLNVLDAAVECIYSEVLNEIMPIGAVRCHGLILLNGIFSERYLEDYSESIPAALLIRDQALRPAHFMRARSFVPLDQYAKTLINDTDRLSLVMNELNVKLGGDTSFLYYLSKFLHVSAQQFSFAFINGITHGAISPSNLSMDGRWLDLTCASFVPGGGQLLH